MTHNWEFTGNHYVAFPCVSLVDGGIHRVNVLHAGLNGLLEWAAGEGTADEGALLRPLLTIDGEPVPLRSMVWDRLERWIPRFRAELDGEIGIEATLCAPDLGTLTPRGGIYRFELVNRGARLRRVEVSLQGLWRWSLRRIVTGRALSGSNRVFCDSERAIVLEAGWPPCEAALALTTGGSSGCKVSVPGLTPGQLAPGESLEVANGTEVAFCLSEVVSLPPGGKDSVTFYFGVAQERDGALATASALRRLGSDAMVRGSRLELARLSRRAPDNVLGDRLNRNLLFNFFFSVGRAIDDDRLYPVNSRSPLGPANVSVGEREVLLWSLPAITLGDAQLARELLLNIFENYSHYAGAGSHYLRGGMLAPGFALDRFCAYAIALDRYVKETGDRGVLDVPIIQTVLRELDALAMERLHPRVFLFDTEIAPSDEAAAHPFLTIDNVLVWAFCRAVDRCWIADGGDDRPRSAGAADEIAAAIWRHCTVEADGLRVLAWSTDLEDEAAIYDDPRLSLQLLPFLGFCDKDDPIWRNTVELLRSTDNPFWYEGTFPGTGRQGEPPQAHIAALCADLLGSRRVETLELLKRLTLEAGVAGETYSTETGETTGGPYHAALAGFLAWSLWHAVQQDDAPAPLLPEPRG